MSWTEDDKQIAERALETLKAAHRGSRSAAAHTLEPLRSEMGNKRPDDIPERPDAWLAVSRLYQTLAEDPDSEELVFQWQDAIDKTHAWLKAMQ